MISCDEANHNCDKSQYKEASIWEKLRLNIHLVYCRACRKYSMRNTRLSKLLKDDQVECLNDNEKASLKRVFDKELANND